MNATKTKKTIKLLEIKRKYDPAESLYEISGVGSDKWNYNLNNGLLCQKE